MAIGKKELRLLMILGLILYAYLFYQFVLTKAFPEISDVQKKISAASEQKKSLDQDIKNIEIKKIDLNSKTVAYEKLDGYIAENADITDSIEYIKKLERFLGNNLTNITISMPKEDTFTTDDKSKSEKKCYEFKCDFKTNLNYNDTTNLLDFIEGSTRRVNITRFSLTPAEEKKDNAKNNKNAAANNANQASATPKEQKFDIEMSISLYSLIIKNDNFGNLRLNKYIDDGWNIAGVTNVSQSSQLSQVSQVSQVAQASQASQASTAQEGPDISIIEQSVMTAGDNLAIYGVNPGSEFTTLKTAGKIDVKLKMTNNSYTIETTRVATGKNNIVMGTLPPKNDINIKVSVNLPIIQENKDIALNLIITNSTSKKINITLEDSLGRVKITDRSGAVVRKSSSKEKVDIL